MYRSEYCVVWEDPNEPDEPAKITHPDPNWMACALQGGILPPGFEKHTRGPELLHNIKPIDAMTEEQAIEYLIQKDIPMHVWQDSDKSNKPRMVICKKSQLPSTRSWRNSWRINPDCLNIDNIQETA